MNKFSPMLPLSLGLIVALSGCAASKTVRQTENAGSNLANQHFDVSRKPQKESRSFVVEDTFYAARKPISVTPVNPSVSLPEAFRKSANMDVQSPIALTEIGSRITKITGYPVVVDQDVVSRGSNTRAAAAPVAATPPLALPGAGPLPDASSPPGALPPLPTPVELSSAPSDTVLSEVVYRGDLTGLLNEVTGRLNLSWRWTGSRIEIFRYSTQTFRLDAMAGKATSSSKLNTTSSTSSGGGSSGGGSSGDSGNQGSSGSDISISNDLEIWKDVEDNLKQVLSSGGKLSVNTSAGLITVIDTPAVQRQVEALVTEYNRIYSKQVMLNVEVYSVERQKGDNYSLNWDALWSRASSSLGFTFNSAQGGIGGPAFTIDVKDGPFSGSSVVGQALSTMGNTSLLTSSTAITLNGQTVPLNVSREVAYVQSTSSAISGSDSSLASTTITPGVATEGLSMNFTPRILDNNQVLVRYSIDLSVIEAIEDFASPNGESAVQLPRRSVRNFLQNVSIPSGQSLVLTGFQQTQATRDGQGPFSPSAWWAGGNKKANSTSRTIVIVLTPYVSQR